MAGQSRGDLDALRERAASGDTAARDALAEVVANRKSDKHARVAAVQALATLGEGALAPVEALTVALEARDAALRSATVDLLIGAGATAEDWSEVAAECLARGDETIAPLLGTWGASALPVILPSLLVGKPSVRTAAAHALVEIAGELDGTEVAEALHGLLTSDKEPLQRLALETVARLRRPPGSLAEPVADLSRFPGARRALLRFDKTWVKRELRSLLKSQSVDERLCGLAIVQQYGASAAEFAELVASVLARDTQVQTAVAAIHALGRILPESELAQALEPSLDHWSEEVRAAARSYLSALDVEPRSSVWHGHPFSDALIRELQRLGCKPHGSMQVPQERLVEGRLVRLNHEETRELIEPIPVSPAIWALTRLVSYPRTMFHHWNSFEQLGTFHFSWEDEIYAVPMDGEERLMHVFGDGSIGYFAAIDLRDTSNDPALYYLERWYPEGWRVARQLSAYLRQLGHR